MLVSIMNPVWRIFPNRKGLIEAALQIIRQSEAESGSTFSVVLAGGQTPIELYQALAKQALNWEKWRIYFGDERCLPPEHPDRNSSQAMKAFLGRVPIAADHIFIPPAELGPAESATRYNEVMAPLGDFDLVLLGLGEDGHTASLFPGHDMGAAGNAADVLPVFGAPKPPPERVSLSARRLSRSRRVLFLVTGSEKRAAVSRWRHGAELPAARICAAQDVVVLADEAACPP
jgi:6-phosphogluconolactonase